MSETLQIELLRTVPALIGALAAISCAVIQIVGQRNHRNHEATTNDNNAQLTILLNGGLQDRIDEAVKRHVGETLK